ncbi:ribonuclease [Rhizobium dioscoreae]|uniref:Ribonuclease n=1 Tax=Rhizobium dioscoreae TaxID=2653122 RepID=A0ABQ0YYN5_9HYPH|nr:MULTISPECIES: ribonuclease [Rhizobium]MCZ3377345.1 ribonuclease [Rhizobium sp. AG207R]TWB18149.1 ribonuclease T2 [Rhizobium sp. ERR1071]GES45879.1 ribonuclease [Rhizobium dioscoreae]GES48218.1 ribonuclease [Rhizobium dioscoreae]GLU79313.1 ribonuclease [Rhizobium sp. NBRC 114257]
MKQWLRVFTVVLVSVGAAASAMAQEHSRGRTRFILAASWEPAFCQTNQKKAECRNQSSNNHDATNFSLHGLWPMRQEYCDVSEDLKQADRGRDWKDLPAVQLSQDVKVKLDKVMPGTQSGLERHEWIKHGTCTKLSADQYFSIAAGLIAELNTSAVRDLFAQNIGKELDAESIKAAFDQSFGEGANARIKMSCRRVGDVRMISELTIGLSEDAIDPQQGSELRLAKLIQGAGSTSFGCDRGVVDAAGF